MHMVGLSFADSFRHLLALCQMGNKGAFIRFEADMKPKYTKFEAVTHPNARPMQYASMGGLNLMQFLGGN